MVRITKAFPGGNILVKSIDGFQIVLEPELRDTDCSWFYWYFEAEFDTCGTYDFSIITGSRGPALSPDGGRTWQWLGTRKEDHSGFLYEHKPGNVSKVRFCVGMQYLQSDLERFLETAPGIEKLELCKSRQGRSVELLKVGNGAKKLLVTTRHHCCEMMATYVLEGILSAAAKDETFRNRATLYAIPFADKDGVENGDQGKCRKPYDHARDYGQEHFLYPETAAITALLERERPEIVFDMHCPWLHSHDSETLYFVGPEKPRMHEAMLRWSRALSSVIPQDIPFDPADNIPFGVGWNSSTNYTQGKTLARFSADFDFIGSALSLEVPYANLRNCTFTPEMMRRLGNALFQVFRMELA